MDSIGVIPGPFTTADVLAVLWLFLAWLGSGWLVEQSMAYAGQVRTDHALFVEAFKEGRVGLEAV